MEFQTYPSRDFTVYALRNASWNGQIEVVWRIGKLKPLLEVAAREVHHTVP